jgi:hypothetical protein
MGEQTGSTFVEKKVLATGEIHVLIKRMNPQLIGGDTSGS